MDFSPATLSGFSLRKTNSYEVKDHFKRIKHGHQVSVNALVMTFPTFDSAASFQIDYRVTAANMPVPLTGKLNVKVVK
jgi:hypothetical protein